MFLHVLKTQRLNHLNGVSNEFVSVYWQEVGKRKQIKQFVSFILNEYTRSWCEHRQRKQRKRFRLITVISLCIKL